MSPSLVTEVTGIVLAGGKSKRFGKDKAFLNIKGTPLINRVISVMKQVFQKVILIANEPDKYLKIGLPVFSDVIKDLGPIGGILTGILHMQTQAGFFVACNLLFLNPALLRYLSSVENPRGSIRCSFIPVAAHVLTMFTVFCGISGSTSTIFNDI